MNTNVPSTSLPPLPLTKESIDAIQFGFHDKFLDEPIGLISPTDNISNKGYRLLSGGNMVAIFHTGWGYSDRLDIIVYDIRYPDISSVRTIRITENYDPSNDLSLVVEEFSKKMAIESLKKSIHTIALQKLENPSID